MPSAMQRISVMPSCQKNSEMPLYALSYAMITTPPIARTILRKSR